jgi:hypothetical protein
MNVVIVYDSLFGNTRAVAEAIADGARRVSTGPVRCTAIAHAVRGDVESADLLVVGGPTHMLGLSSRRSREAYLRPEDLAAGRSRDGHALEEGADGDGLREWLACLPHARSATPPGAAAFDTRLDRAFAGSAARAVHRRLRRLGYRMVAPAQSFFVEAMEGPLPYGQIERAKRWGADLVATHEHRRTQELLQGRRG